MPGLELKIAGSLLIAAASFILGNRQAAKLRARVRELEEFRLGLRMISAEIGHARTPLPEALNVTAARLSLPEISMFFQGVSSLLAKNTLVQGAPAAWSQTLSQTGPRLSLLEADYAVLLRAASGLGSLDAKSQIKQLELAEQQLSSLADQAAANCNEKEKMWRYLGVMGGVAIIILLF